MSVAYERPPEWELPVRSPDPVRSVGAGPREVGTGDLTVLTFPPRPARPETRPYEQPAGEPAARVLDAEAVRTFAPPELWPALPVPAAEEIRVSPQRARVVASPRQGPRPCPASAPEQLPVPGLRLTARGQRLVRLLATTCVLGLLAVGAWCLTAQLTAPVVPDSAPSVVVVHSGESLWSIAHDIAPHSDPRKVVAALQERNHLGSSVVRVGQALEIPK